jgi:16S rRNA G966 N2-methylase RsmD
MKITDDVLAVLSGLTFADSTAKIEKQIDRKLYEKTNKVLESLGGKWNRGKKCHVFPSNAQDLVESVMLTGEVQTNSDIGFFPTPMELAHQIVSATSIGPGSLCLEPSAGTGNLVEAMVAAGARVVAVEKDPKLFATLSARVAKMGLDKVEVFNEDIFLFGQKAQQSFDHVIMNPPFKATIHISHVRHAHTYLKTNTNGSLISVMPSGVMFREDRAHAEFRSWVYGQGGDMDALPPQSFKESGTHVNTCLVTVPA